ncbi:MAG: hypothetical protein K8T25_13155 [Planctomycetia bacterium]|nr:hypothetical protein [Planctomycetia bacterium]
MKATSSFASLSVASLLVGFAAAPCAHGADWPVGSLAVAAVGQAAPADETDPAALLRSARAAMNQGQWVEADACIRRAESHWSVFHNPLGDNPKRARRDLERMRAGGAPERPSDKVQPMAVSALNSTEHAPAGGKTDPFRRVSADTDALISDKKPEAMLHLKKGRDALAQGNMPEAIYFQSRAAQLAVKYGADEDSPAKLADEIRRRGGSPAPVAAAAAVAMPSLGDDNAPQRPAGLSAPGMPPAGLAGNAPRNSEIRPLPTPQNTNRYEQPGEPAMPSDRYAQAPQADPQQARKLMLEARRALAGGDTRRALALAAEARAGGQQYGPQEDSPTKIEILARRHNEAMQRRGAEGDSEATNRAYAQVLLEEAESLAQYQDYESAERAAGAAAQMRVDFSPYENNPRRVMQRIAEMRRQGAGAAADNRYANRGDVRLAGGEYPNTAAGGVATAGYDPQRDNTHNLAAGAEGPDLTPSARRESNGPVAKQAESVLLGPPADNNPAPAPRSLPGAGSAPLADDAPHARNGSIDGSAGETPRSQAAEWVREGDEALAHRDLKTALDFYNRAARHRDQLDPTTARHLQEHLQLLSQSAPPKPLDNNLLVDASNSQQRLQQQVASDLVRQTRKAQDMREQDPRGALAELKRARAAVEQSALTPPEKKVLLGRTDRSIVETEQYIEAHKSEIELNEKNKAVTNSVERGRARKVQVEEKLALLVDEFNRLRDERRFQEAEIKAKQAREIAPDNPVTMLMWREIVFYKRTVNNRDTEERKEDSNYRGLDEVNQAAIADVGDRNPEQFIAKADWDQLTNRRRKWGKDPDRKRSAKEIEIEQKLRTPVSLAFKDAPLIEVIDYLKKVTAVNIYLDPAGLAAEGVDTSTPVRIDLSQEISLQSALNLILQPLHLGYVIRDEVLKITSEQHKNGNVYTKVYNVADLVIPIPDFVPHNHIGLPQAISDGYATTAANLGAAPGGFQPSAMAVAPHSINMSGGPTPPGVLGQSLGGGMTTGGARGGTASADFDGLIELMTKTIEPESWDEVGGPGSIKPSQGNLSLVISQTQEVHEKIADLLEQLRRLQDLQVTIEVRFITLSDNFFERIGVDFDFNIRDNATGATVAKANTGVKMEPSATIGLNPATDTNPFPNYVSNGAIQFRNNSFDSALPPFGGFNPSSAATFGIAILSDIEAFFLVQAAQGDSRTNVMQAPKVTLFNGQAASISDQSQTPFVTSVTPVVGDFAAAQAPVIVVLNSGTTLSVQAVVSQDRRFVRLTLIPFFSQIGDVKEFMFTGSTTTNKSSSDSSADQGDTTSSSDNTQTTTNGTTVQLPTFIFTTVTTTVSVPDGGTVLLGGVKRLKEGRNEFGVPILSKIPYIDRLFKNVGIGREAQSLMLMVTPRIIIQEEEEEKLGLTPPEQ